MQSITTNRRSHNGHDEVLIKNKLALIIQMLIVLIWLTLMVTVMVLGLTNDEEMLMVMLTCHATNEHRNDHDHAYTPLGTQDMPMYNYDICPGTRSNMIGTSYSTCILISSRTHNTTSMWYPMKAEQIQWDWCNIVASRKNFTTMPSAGALPGGTAWQILHARHSELNVIHTNVYCHCLTLEQQTHTHV